MPNILPQWWCLIHLRWLMPNGAWVRVSCGMAIVANLTWICMEGYALLLKCVHTWRWGLLLLCSCECVHQPVDFLNPKDRIRQTVTPESWLPCHFLWDQVLDWWSVNDYFVWQIANFFFENWSLSSHCRPLHGFRYFHFICDVFDCKLWLQSI